MYRSEQCLNLDGRQCLSLVGGEDMRHITMKNALFTGETDFRGKMLTLSHVANARFGHVIIDMSTIAYDDNKQQLSGHFQVQQAGDYQVLNFIPG